MLRFGVIGNPIAHSLSPAIHEAFARQTGRSLCYERVLAPLESFAQTVAGLRDGGFAGANVTLPFKLEALAHADQRTERAQRAGAANTLVFKDSGIRADNTDGIGFLTDLRRVLSVANGSSFGSPAANTVILGAGGAARGILGPLTDTFESPIHISSRRPEQAAELADRFGPEKVRVVSWDEVHHQPASLVINATSASLDGASGLPPGLSFDGVVLAYDLAYLRGRPTPFMQAALTRGALQVSDGLGMLVEQAAEAFLIWHGERPLTAPVLAGLRAS